MRAKSNLLRLRQERGMTVRGLADASGIPFPTVEKWCQIGVPETVDYAVRIADALGVEVRDLYEPGDG